MSTICTTCPYCGVGCGLIVSDVGKISGDPDHPANFGRVCSKGAALEETLDLDGRLLAPKIGRREADWEEALDLVAARFSNAIRDYGSDSVAFYVSGQLLSEDYYVANKLMKGFIGSANIDTNSRLCMASSVAGHKRAFGSDTVPGTYEDLEQADVIVLTGSNLAWCHPVLFQRILAAKANRPQMKIVVIDPRSTASSKAADLHLPIRADGDTALFNSLLCEIDNRGAVDRDYVASHVNGFDAGLAEAKSHNIDDCGLTEEALQRFYDLWISSEKVVTVYSQGINQSTSGSDKVNAIINCHLATGRIGRPGMGPFSITGQPNAMGGREVGGLANMLACHLDIENPEHRAVVQDEWQSPTICTKPGLKAVDLFSACAEGKIKALWIMSTNPAVSMPDADGVASAIENVEFSVVSEIVEKTDTSVLTDVQLPATGWGEKTGTVTNSERRISLQRAFLPSPGAARPDWQIICEVAQRMGWKEEFTYSGPAEIFREYASLSGRAASLGSDFDISGLKAISDEQYDKFAPVQWPVADNASLTDKQNNSANGRFFAKGGFYHSDHKARIIPVTPLKYTPAMPGIFRLNTGRIRDQWHTMTRSGKSQRLSQHLAEPFIEIHPEDAFLLGVKETELLEIEMPQSDKSSRIIVRAMPTSGIARGSVFVPMHWSRTNTSAGRINDVVQNFCDPVSGQPALKGGQVRLKPFRAQWYAFAASSAQMHPCHDYSAVATTHTGWSCELAGQHPVSDWEDEARKILGLRTGDASMMVDDARGIIRVAIHENTKLAGLFFAGPKPVNVARAHSINQINTTVAPLSALAGLPMCDQPDPGRSICACFNVGINTICQSIHEGATNISAIGKATAAGTNCGSCKSDLQTLIDAAAVNNTNESRTAA